MSSLLVTSNLQERSSWLARILVFLLILCGVYLYYGHHAYHTMDKWVFTGDVRLYLPPLFSYYDSTLANPDDYLIEMARNTYLPIGYKLLYKIVSYGLDPITFSKFLPYILITIFATIMSFASKEIAGFSGLSVTLIIVLTTDIFLERMMGGLPRAFGYPIAALTLWGMTANKPSYLITATLLGAGFYPATTLFSGFALVVLIFCPPIAGGFNMSLSLARRIGLVFLTIFTSYIIFVPMYYQIIRYGGLIATHDISQYLPEHYSAPFSFIYSMSKYSLSLFGTPLFPFALIMLLTSFSFSCFQYQTARRLLTVIILLFMVHWILAFTSDAYFSERLRQYFIPVILLAMVPFLIKNCIYCIHSVAIRPIPPQYFWLIPCFLIALIVCIKPNKIDQSVGVTVSIPEADRKIYNFIQTLPSDGLIAGWPGKENSIIDNVPYLAKHSAFFTEESHQEFYARPQNLLRSRFKDLVDAYFATNITSLINLRDRWKVHYLIVDTRHFKDHPPVYKPELQSLIDKQWSDAYIAKETFTVLNLLASASVFKQGPIFILDLYQIKAQ